MNYDAFISYSHGNDTRIAKALQDNLHRLAKRWDSLSAIRVFRDATHLPITSLQPALVSALAASKFLILLASPQSAASKWVREEVARFLETHPPERVLIVLIAGDLVWDESLGRFVAWTYVRVSACGRIHARQGAAFSGPTLGCWRVGPFALESPTSRRSSDTGGDAARCSQRNFGR